MRVFLLIGSSAKTPQPCSFDRRRMMRGSFPLFILDTEYRATCDFVSRPSRSHT